MIGGSAGACWDGVRKAEALEVEGVDEGIDEADGVILGDVIIQGFGKQGELVSIGALDVLHRRSPCGQRALADLPCITPDFPHRLSLKLTRRAALSGMLESPAGRA
jgi:hypothetical protein